MPPIRRWRKTAFRATLLTAGFRKGEQRTERFATIAAVMTTVVQLLRRVAATRPVAKFLQWYPVRRVVATGLRSATVRSRALFVVRELARSDGTVGYRLRGSGRQIFVRHGTPDIVTLDEVFYRRDYKLPRDVERLLDELDRPPVALDLGANIGLFGVFLLERFPEAQIVAIEADEHNIPVLRLCADANGGERNWRIIQAAATNFDGMVRFVSGEYSLSRIGEEGEPVDAVDVLPCLADSDIAKIDIEGGEWAILADLRLSSTTTRAIVLEYHPYLCPEPDPRIAATHMLAEAGFEVLPVHHYEHGHGVLWGRRV
jgi:FkbM family methyltransferase